MSRSVEIVEGGLQLQPAGATHPVLYSWLCYVTTAKGQPIKIR